jgi:hypothetical protein
MWHFCKRCKKNWWGVKKEPKTCRWCGSRLWDKDRERAEGGGRPVGSGVAGAGPVGERGAGEVSTREVEDVQDDGSLGSVGVVGVVDVVGVSDAASAEVKPRRAGRLKRMVVKTRVERVGDGQVVEEDPEVW